MRGLIPKDTILPMWRPCPIVIVFVLLVASCSLDSGSRTVLPEDTLKLSCLTNIKLGASTGADLAEALNPCKTVMNIEVGSWLVNVPPTVTYRWQTSASKASYADVTNDVVVLVGFSVEKGITLDTTLQKYGPPEYVERGEAFNPDRCIGVINLFYPSKGISLILIGEYPCGHDLEIGPNVMITGYEFYQSGTIDQVLKRAYLLDDETVEKRKNKLRVWKDYSSLKRDDQ